MRLNGRSPLITFSLVTLVTVSLLAADVPTPLKARFVIGDPVWRELPIRDDLQTQYEKVWQTAIATILENNFDIATMDKDSGYARTTWNEGVVVLGGHWSYKVQISLKLVTTPDSKGNSPLPTIQKIRVQAAGELAETKKGNLKKYYRGYDSVLLQNLFQDLQQKLGTR
jgi:hypothetical protein